VVASVNTVRFWKESFGLQHREKREGKRKEENDACLRGHREPFPKKRRKKKSTVSFLTVAQKQKKSKSRRKRKKGEKNKKVFSPAAKSQTGKEKNIKPHIQK